MSKVIHKSQVHLLKKEVNILKYIKLKKKYFTKKNI